MKKIITTILIAAMFSSAYGFAGGDGSPSAPYVITTAADLDNVNNGLAASYVLGGDIDLSGITYDKAVIAHSDQFTGTFDGAGYTITALTINSSNNYAGFIGQTRGAVIQNLTIEQASITTGSNRGYIGVLCGYSFNATVVSNCFVSGEVSGGSHTGGLIGYNQLSSVENCISTCTVSGTTRVGGLIGYNHNNSPVTNCYATGNISGTEEVGGLIGKNQTAVLSDCYATGDVSGIKYVGGLYGYNQLGSTTNCYATGDVFGDESVGGLCGYNFEGSFANCYAEGNTYGNTYVGGFMGYNIRGEIAECYAIGDVETAGKKAAYSGGFVGRNDSGLISYCYATGSVEGGDFNGGFAGYNNSGLISVCSSEGNVVGSGEKNGGFIGAINTGTVRNCYAWGDVEGKSYTGGFCGQLLSGSIEKSYSAGFVNGNGNYIGCFLGVTWVGSLSGCFWDSQLSGGSCSGFAGSTGLTTAEMMDIDSFLSAGWNFNDIWVMPASGYPAHKWLDIDIPMLGSGTRQDPYQLATQAHLEQVNMNLNAHYLLVDDIDLSSTIYTTAIIAADANNSSYTFSGDIFMGTFDGNGYVISGVKIDTQGQNNNYLGLFGYTSRGSVKNVVLEDVSIVGGDNSNYVGSLIGYNSSTTITDCQATGGVITMGDGGSFYGGLVGRNARGTISGSSADIELNAGEGSMYVGGFIGYNYMNGTIIGCSSASDVYAGTNSESIGGFCGRNWYGAISDSYAAGFVSSDAATLYIGGFCGFNSGTLTGSFAASDISTQGSYVGGFAGYNFYGRLINCYAAGDIIEAESYVGGLIGTNFKGILEDCYAAGAVNGNSLLGGLCATDTLPTITACFWDIETTGQTQSAGGVGKSTAEMKNIITFTGAGWNFPADWTIAANEYPQLVYPNIPLPQSLKKFSGGYGTEGYPYEIANAADWSELISSSDVWGSYFILVNNIDLADIDILPIGDETTSFAGKFDGGGYKISNAEMVSNFDNQGLFGITDGAEFRNMVINNVAIAGGSNVGALIGKAYDTLIEKSSVSGNIAASGDNAGALAGFILSGTFITECSANVFLQGDGQCAGGLVGRSSASDVVSSFATGQTFGAGGQFGGLVGRADSGSVIYKSFSTGEVVGNTATITAGGLVGTVDGSQILDCFTTSQVSGMDAIGGLVGESNTSAIVNCYAAAEIDATGTAGGLIAVDTASIVSESFWDTDVSNVGVSAGGSGLQTWQLQMELSFAAAGWDFDDVWWLPTADYPKFKTAMKGAGTHTAPYRVENQYHLETINNGLEKTHYVLMADIDLSGKIYNSAVIAADEDSSNPEFVGESFSGVFNGNGYKITGLTIDTSGQAKSFVGLFGRINGGIVKNLFLEDVYVVVDDQSRYVGGIAGWNNSVNMTNCYVTGQIITGDNADIVGGLVGENRGTITTCFSGIQIAAGAGTKSIGALVGRNALVGGGSPANISNCYARGSVIAVAGAYENKWEQAGSGGLVGTNWKSVISNSYADTLISGANNIGGLCGFSSDGSITGSFWNTETTGIADSQGGQPLTNDQMFDNQVFASAGWDFSAAWIHPIGEYPSLAFESSLSPQGAEPLNIDNIEKLMFIANNWLEPASNTTVDLNQSSDDDLIDMKIFSTLFN